MNSITFRKVSTQLVGVLTIILTCIGVVSAQVQYSLKDKASLVVSGTSTLHDWDMNSTTATCTATFILNAANHLTNVTAIQFSTPIAELKSKHSAMDKNAYKALNKDKAPNISFVLTAGTASIIDAGNGNYTLKCKGKLNIAGSSVETDLSANCKLNADKTITVTGSKNISMKDYNVTPPSFMMGAVKTGNDIVLKFNLTLKS